MLETSKLISNWIEDDVKTVLKGEHTQWRQAGIRRNSVKANVHLNETEKRSMYEKYCEEFQSALMVANKGFRFGKMPRWDE